MISTESLIRAKRRKKKWTMLTAYDAPTAQMLESAGIDWLLVGDSLGMVLLGYPSTVTVTMDEMIHHAKAVRQGASRAFVIGDMPLLGIQKGPRQALESARRFIREAGCDAVKIEWSPKAIAITDLLVRRGIPVMGHVGLTPQTAIRTGGFKVRGRNAGKALRILEAARAFEAHGAFSVLLECVPVPVAAAVTRALRIPTIGIGAGPHCDGQVLVFHDLVGLFKKFTPRFVKRYANLETSVTRAVSGFIRDVRRGRFPESKHGFRMNPDEEKEFQWRLKHSE